MSSSAERNIAASAVADERLENLRQKAREAAQDDFLWELGIRAPSPNQARNVCKIFGIANEDEKRVKAVAVLRDQYPDVLQEIREAASFEEDTMPEVVLGPIRIELLKRQKDEELWSKIAQSLGVQEHKDLLAKFKDDHPVTDMVTSAKITLPRSARFSYEYKMVSSSPMYSVVFSQIRRDVHFDTFLRSWHFFRNPFIRVHPANFDPERELPEYAIKGILTLKMNRLPFFYNAAERGVPSLVGHGILIPASWSNVIVEVMDKSILPLAKRIAEAYERETRRRRKPAKAVVVKNY